MECEKNFLGKHLYLIEEQWPTWHFKLGHFKSGLSQTTCLILKLWTTDIIQTITNGFLKFWRLTYRTDFSSFTVILIQPIFMLFRFNFHCLLRKKWTELLLLSHNEMKTNQQHQQMKREFIGKAMKLKYMLQSLLELCGMPDTKTNCKHTHSEMTVILCTHLRPVSTPFFKIYLYYHLLLWKYMYLYMR